MKKVTQILSTIILVIGMVLTANALGEDCISGGEGASSCSTTKEIPGGYETITRNCREGYYACCTDKMETSGCRNNDGSDEPKGLF
jgi:hypothetical protein